MPSYKQPAAHKQLTSETIKIFIFNSNLMEKFQNNKFSDFFSHLILI